jgi:Tfp pilus assembly protein PilZ
MTIDEKRSWPRHHFLAEIQYRSNCPPLLGRIMDLGEGGIFIDTMVPLAAGAPVTFSFFIPDNYPDISITGSGRVAWQQKAAGMGVEFLQMNEKSRERIKSFLKSL